MPFSGWQHPYLGCTGKYTQHTGRGKQGLKQGCRIRPWYWELSGVIRMLPVCSQGSTRYHGPGTIPVVLPHTKDPHLSFSTGSSFQRCSRFWRSLLPPLSPSQLSHCCLWKKIWGYQGIQSWGGTGVQTETRSPKFLLLPSHHPEAGVHPCFGDDRRSGGAFPLHPTLPCPQSGWQMSQGTGHRAGIRQPW